MVYLKIALIIWSLCLLIGALIPMFRTKVWWLRAWTYARIQILWLTALTLIFWFAFIEFDKKEIAAIITGALLIAALCLRDILPFTSLGQTQTPEVSPHAGQKTLKLFVGNVLMENESHQDLLNMIAETSPDIIFLVETDEKWQSFISPIEGIFAHKYLLPLPDFNGMLFYSKFPIIDAQERYLVQDHIPSLTFELDMGDGDRLKFYGLHPRPPRPEDDTADLDKELEIVAKEVETPSIPTIVTGDLNDVGWSTTSKRFLNLSKLKDPRRGRGLYNSYNAKNPLVRWPLDHVFHSDHFGLVTIRRLPAFGSDHFPIFVELAII